MKQNKSIDGESIVLSDLHMPAPVPCGEGSDVDPTIVLKPGTDILGGSSVDMQSEPIDNTTVLFTRQNTCCVGWLLAVSGPMAGNSYILEAGRNSVGRSSSNKVCLAADDGISRNSQVFVVYDPEENAYMVTPGDGSAIARLNGKRLDAASPLKLGDMISLSKRTVLRFVPACDDTFRWGAEETGA